MFTGLIEEVGRISAVSTVQNGRSLKIVSRDVISDLKSGDSVSVDGICLTVTELEKRSFSVDLVKETLQRSTLGELKVQDEVNLERPLKLGQRIGGHFVQGHVDAVGQIAGLSPEGNMLWMTVEYPQDLRRYIVQKGSITIDGISLTVAEKNPESIAIAIIPHTFEHTGLRNKKINDLVNIEVDMMAKYVESCLQNPGEGSNPINIDWLREQGFA